MRVYLVPVGIERYALYCEVHDDPGEAEGRPRGFLRRWFGEFLEAIRQAEPGRRRRPRASEPASSSRFRRAWRWGLRRLMRWVAASVAEQRLLWHLRRQSTSHLTHPDDLAPDEAGRPRDERDRHDASPTSCSDTSHRRAAVSAFLPLPLARIRRLWA